MHWWKLALNTSHVSLFLDDLILATGASAFNTLLHSKTISLVNKSLVNLIIYLNLGFMLLLLDCEVESNVKEVNYDNIRQTFHRCKVVD